LGGRANQLSALDRQSHGNKRTMTRPTPAQASEGYAGGRLKHNQEITELLGRKLVNFRIERILLENRGIIAATSSSSGSGDGVTCFEGTPLATWCGIFVLVSSRY
jgi:hypothetical protein